MAVTYSWYRTPTGFITITSDGAAITALVWGCVDIAGAQKQATPLATAAADQLLEYLAGKRRTFDFPINPKGSEFQRAAWNALQRVPYGTTVTATALADAMGCPQSYKAVGAALKANPLAVVIPDHRVVTAAGKHLGSTKEAQQREFLFRFEQARIQ